MSILPAASIAPRILVVDDDEDIRFPLVGGLRQDLAGGDSLVIEADNLGSAIDKYEGNKETLWAVVTDMQMPGGGDAGLQLYRYVRQHAPRLPVFLMSSGMSADVKKDVLALQAADPRFSFHPKPIGLTAPITWLRSVWRMVLLVDDEENMTRSIRRGLTGSFGLVSEDVLMAPDLESALQVYADHRQRIAAALTDMEMLRSQGSVFLRDAGLQLYDSIRADNPTLPVAFMSGGMPKEVRAQLDATLEKDPRTRFDEKLFIPIKEIANWFRGFWSGTRPA